MVTAGRDRRACPAHDVIAGLARRGHRVSRAGDWSLGRLSAVGIDHARGVLWGAANPRGMQGYAVGR
jgi:gamma-glutamyltranspeptidase / glutathione hydrolase